MKKDPVKTAQEILKAFGGKENVISATHCATRLRVEVKDASVIDVEAMKEISGVAGYFSKSGHWKSRWPVNDSACRKISSFFFLPPLSFQILGKERFF